MEILVKIEPSFELIDIYRQGSHISFWQIRFKRTPCTVTASATSG